MVKFGGLSRLSEGMFEGLECLKSLFLLSLIFDEADAVQIGIEYIQLRPKNINHFAVRTVTIFL